MAMDPTPARGTSYYLVTDLKETDLRLVSWRVDWLVDWLILRLINPLVG